MPSANLYFDPKKSTALDVDQMTSVRRHIATLLTGASRTLCLEEVSLRQIPCHGEGMTATREIEITAMHYPERVRSADEICLALQTFVNENFASEGTWRVWLHLHELGHSWTKEEVDGLRVCAASNQTAD